MDRRRRKTTYYVALVVLTTLGFTLAYNQGMAVWEGRPQSLTHSLEVVIQSFTTTGYGEDAPWETPQMHVLVVVMQLAGIGLILTAVDVFAVPWLRSAVAPSPPDSVGDLADHVVICGDTPRTAAFLAELDSRGQPGVLVEPDSEVAIERHEAGRRVVAGDPESAETLANAGIEEAAALVADVDDETNASVVLAARDVNPGVRAITLVEDASLARYHRAAGAEEVLSPRQLLGRHLAREAPTAVATDVGEGVEVGEDFELVELRLGAETGFGDPPVHGRDLHERFGVTLIGAWVDGTFEAPVDPGMAVGPGTRVLVAGDHDRIDALRADAAATVRPVSEDRVVVAGYGESGRATAEALEDTGTDVTVVDERERDGVDVVGDARDPETLAGADIDSARTLVVTVSDDTTAAFTTLVARERDPDLRILVRANQEDNVRKLYRAGADYVQSLATVSGRMLASTVFEDETVLAVDAGIRVDRLPAPGLEGTTLAGADVRAETGATVVAVVRDGETLTDLDPAFRFEPADDVVVVGTDDSVRTFERRFGT